MFWLYIYFFKGFLFSPCNIQSALCAICEIKNHLPGICYIQLPLKEIIEQCVELGKQDKMA